MPPIRSHLRVQVTWLALMDLACLVLGCVIGVVLRFGPEEMAEYVFGHIDGWFLLCACVILANYLAGSYRMQYTFSRFNLVVIWAFSLVFALFIISILSYAWVQVLLGRGVLVLSIAAYSILSLFIKLLVYRSLFRSEVLLCRTVIIGTGERAQSIRNVLEQAFILPAHQVIAFIDVSDETPADAATDAFIDNTAVMRTSKDKMVGIVRGLGAALIAVGVDDSDRISDLYGQLKRLRFEGIEVLMPLDLAEIYAGKTPVDLVNEEEMMRATLQCGLPVYRRVKRLMDVVVSLVLGVVLLPVALIAALVIKISEPHGPVLYRQERLGLFGKVFRIIKFRTMQADAEKETGAVWAQDVDPRVTPVGNVLRMFRIDEIPQLINVLRGEMSLVGPRPERPELTTELAAAIPWYEERENIMPGVTGWAQIRYPYGSSVEDARRKLEYDLYYLKHMSLSLDLQIILRTIRIVLLGKERSV